MLVCFGPSERKRKEGKKGNNKERENKRKEMKKKIIKSWAETSANYNCQPIIPIMYMQTNVCSGLSRSVMSDCLPPFGL